MGPGPAGRDGGESASRATFRAQPVTLNLELYKRSCKRNNFAVLRAAKKGSTNTVKHTLEMGGDCNLKADELIKLVEDISLHRRSRSRTFGLVQQCNSMR